MDNIRSFSCFLCKTTEVMERKMEDMKETYMGFVEKIRKEIMDGTCLGENDVYFKKAEDYPQTEGDRLFVTCLVWENSRETLALYVKELYENFCKGTDLHEIVDFVCGEYQALKEAEFLKKIQDIGDYRLVRKHLFVRLLNFDRNEKALKGAILKRTGDIAVVVYMKVGMKDDGMVSMKIQKVMAEDWGISCKEVFEQAVQNSLQLMPPKLWRLERLILEPDYSGEDFMEPGYVRRVDRRGMGECLSTVDKTNGAAAVFFPGVAERLSQLIGSGFYAVFTSIHEVMIHDDRDIDAGSLHPILDGTLEEATKERDFLTRKIGHYHPETGEFTWE